MRAKSQRKPHTRGIRDSEPLHPYDGKTNPKYTGFRDAQTIGADGKLVDSKIIDENGKYSWIKSPRYEGEPMEVGPLASVVVGYASGNPAIVKVVDEFLSVTGLPVEAIFLAHLVEPRRAQ